tara:strand:+ start:201 stop:404 length:204 start_codon:yes stop_codon:yes gene_type:complete
MHTGDFLRKVQQAFQDEVTAIEQNLGTGQCSTLDSYKAECGRIAGLNQASSIVDEQLKQLHEEDDDG